MQSNQSVTLKACWKTTVRRVSVPQSIDYNQLLHKIRILFNQDGLQNEFALKYRDEEGDLITVSSDSEWQLLKNNNNKLKKIIKVELFQSSPSHKYQRFVKPNATNYSHAHPHGHPFFRRWSDDDNDETTTQQNHNIQMVNILNRRARQQLESKSFDDLILAKEALIESLLSFSNNDKNTLYYLACVEALLGKGHQSINYLTKAIENGYTDYTMIEDDINLASLRCDSTYQRLIQSLKQRVKNQSSSSSSDSILH
eukprot:TRINITY_DN1261_c1_g2_i1.p1 TRINITY_DN1261_c1_g2~~TRINITY_DN1261_c1_g2_i1.p1  ORF type:complete len:255 (+),score=60.58 TRINITY_DN1261_c1_g2_i1:75-839(+)